MTHFLLLGPLKKKKIFCTTNVGNFQNCWLVETLFHCKILKCSLFNLFNGSRKTVYGSVSYTTFVNGGSKFQLRLTSHAEIGYDCTKLHILYIVQLQLFQVRLRLNHFRLRLYQVQQRLYQVQQQYYHVVKGSKHQFPHLTFLISLKIMNLTFFIHTRRLC